MDILSLIGIAVGLAMDAFAVSVTNGAVCQKVTCKFAVKLAFSFGFFQLLMPAIGWLVGKAGEEFISSIDHWIALLLLLYIGIQMLLESRKGQDEEEAAEAACHLDVPLKTLLALSVATSIDALAVGITFALLPGVNIAAAVALIGGTTFILSVLGLKAGNIFGAKYKSRAEIAGGVILILIGLKILLEHLEVLPF